MSRSLILIRSGLRLCALPVEHVDETMRPLPFETLPDVPTFVRGVGIVRGRPTPIVDLRALLGDDAQGSPTRLVTLRIDESRRAGLLVDEVLGVRDSQALSTEELPPLLHDTAAEIVKELARLDDQLLTVLRAGSLLPEDTWRLVADQEVSS